MREWNKRGENIWPWERLYLSYFNVDQWLETSCFAYENIIYYNHKTRYYTHYIRQTTIDPFWIHRRKLAISYWAIHSHLSPSFILSTALSLSTNIWRLCMSTAIKRIFVILQRLRCSCELPALCQNWPFTQCTAISVASCSVVSVRSPCMYYCVQRDTSCSLLLDLCYYPSPHIETVSDVKVLPKMNRFGSRTSAKIF